MDQYQSGAQGVIAPETEFVIAGFIMRFIAYIIDSIFVTLIAMIVAFSAAIIWGLENEIILQLVYSTSGIISLFYLLGFWAMAGGTPGKLMLGMRIVGPDGSTNGIGWGRAILRMIGTIISSIPCYLGYIWIIIDKDKQGWHDKIASTYVVNVCGFSTGRLLYPTSFLIALAAVSG